MPRQEVVYHRLHSVNARGASVSRGA